MTPYETLLSLLARLEEHHIAYHLSKVSTEQDGLLIEAAHPWRTLGDRS